MPPFPNVLPKKVTGVKLSTGGNYRLFITPPNNWTLWAGRAFLESGGLLPWLGLPLPHAMQYTALVLSAKSKKRLQSALGMCWTPARAPLMGYREGLAVPILHLPLQYYSPECPLWQLMWFFLKSGSPSPSNLNNDSTDIKFNVQNDQKGLDFFII